MAKVVAGLAVAAVAAACAQPAAAAGTPVGGLRWVLAMDKRLPARLSLGCVQAYGLAWRESGQSKTRELFYATPSGNERAKGTWTPAAKTGSVAGTGDAILFDSLAPKRTRGRPFKLANMGLQFVRGRLYLTGEIRRAKSLAAAARPRRRLAVIARPRLLAGTQRETGKPPVPNTFLFAVQGDAKITKPLADALRRARCSGRFARGRPLRAGARLGQITTQLLPLAATGLGGTVDLVGGLQLHTDLEDVDVTVTPSGGPTVVQTRVSDYVLRYTLPPGTATPLTCNLAGGCFPSGGSFALPGQLALSLNGQTTVLAGLTVSYVPSGDRVPTTVVTGTLDGVPVTVANDPDNPHTLNDDFVARVSAALGGGVALGTIGDVDVSFTATGPV
jgi:hypothetical protein